MKTRRIHAMGGESGFTLMECIVYIGLLAVVLGFATTIFFQSWDDSKALRRDADDIVRVLHAGDQWRADVRAATGPVQLTDTDGAEQLRIPASAGEIVYTFSKGELHRQAAADTVNRVWLSNVKSSQMQSDSRQDVAAWRWELELKTVKKTARWRPLFTFETVAGGGMTR
jgi:Tfp pilus assembly protein FimT